MSTLKLYGANVCPFVHRVRLAMAEKGLKPDYVAIDLRNKPDWYHEVLPSGKVPLLQHDGHRIWESAIVCEYLEESFPEHPLLPGDPASRAKARLWIDWSSNHLVPLFYKLLTAQDADERQTHKEGLTRALSNLDKELGAPGPWLLGDRISLADIELYPWFERWVVLEHYRDFPVPSDLANVVRWRQAMDTRPAVTGIAEKPEFYIEQYVTYANPKTAAAKS